MSGGPSVAELQSRLESEANAYRAVQKEIQKIVENKQTLLSQENENQLVKAELDVMPDDGEVYKLIGPALLLQETAEAKSNVAKRLQWIGDEMKRTDKHIAELEAKGEERKAKIMAMQQQMQQAQAKANGAALMGEAQQGSPMSVS